MGKKTNGSVKSLDGTAKIIPPGSPAPSSSASKRQRSGEDSAADSALSTTARKVPSSTSGGGPGSAAKTGEGEDLVFEDPFGDEFEPEEVEPEGDEDGGTVDGGRGADGMEVIEEAAAAEPPQQETKVWRAGVDELSEGQELEYDSTAYHMYHSLRPEWPCLSFDIIRDSLGTNRSRFPHTVFAVAGTQADRADSNRLQVMKLSDLHRTGKGPAADADRSDGEDSEEEGPDETDDDPVLDHINIPHRGGVNRVRSMPQQPHVVATWSESSDVHVWDLESQVSALAKGAPRTSKVDPAFTFGGHTEVSVMQRSI